MMLVYGILHLLYGVFYQPYFWDELGVYSRSAIHMYQHGLGILPASVPDDLSRGHPLLCPFYFALAFKIFGCQPMVAHFAAAVLNMSGFCFVYGILKKYMQPYTAMASCLAIFVQPLFLSQSVLLLPEMPLMVFTLAAVYFYLEGKYFLLMLFSILALQTKESAIVLPFSFLTAELFRHKKLNSKNLILIFLLPLLFFAGFFAVQKLQRGYYFYPLHTSLASGDWYFIKERLQHFADFFIYAHGHLLLIFSIIIFGTFYMIRQKLNLKSILQSRVLIMPIIIIACVSFLIFNYYLARYTLYFFVFIYLLSYLLLSKMPGVTMSAISLYSLLITATGVYFWNRDKIYTDTDFTYTRHIKSLQMAINELKNKEYNGKNIGMNFPASAVYWNDLNGYNAGKLHQAVSTNDSLPLKEYILLTYPGDMGDTLRYNKQYTMYKEFRSGYAYCRLYRQIPDADSVVIQQ